jgi:NitT/TauT family transport system substrate-binding protein
MSNKHPALGLFLAIIVCLSASCSGANPIASSSSLKVGWTLWQGDYTLLVANQMGFFKNHGLNIEPVYYDSATKAVPELASAKLDGGLFSMSDVLLASSLANIKAVLVSDNGGLYTLVASKDITSVNDLRGKRIGLNLHTSSEIFVSNMLKTKLMTGNDVTYVELSPSQVLQNIPGQIDAGLVWEPYTTQAIQQGKVAVYQSRESSLLLPKLLAFRKTIVDQRPDDIRSFLLAWDEAVNYRLSHPQESQAIISKATGLSADDLALTGGITLYTINDNVELFSNTAGTDPSSIYYLAAYTSNFLLTVGYLTDPPSTSALLDPSFLK